MKYLTLMALACNFFTLEFSIKVTVYRTAGVAWRMTTHSWHQACQASLTQQYPKLPESVKIDTHNNDNN